MSSEDCDKDAEEDITDVDEKEVKEWTMTLRENIICLDEYNVKLKKQKIKAIEQSETREDLQEKGRLIREKMNYFFSSSFWKSQGWNWNMQEQGKKNYLIGNKIFHFNYKHWMIAKMTYR